MLVGVSFDETGKAAVAIGRALAAHHQAKLVLVHASGLAATLDEERARKVRERLERSAERCRGEGLDVETLVECGFAEVVLASAARARHADLVVVGTHGREGAQRVLRGSVAEEVAREGVASVLIVKRATEAGLPERVLVATDFSEPSAAGLEVALAIAAPGARIDVVHAFDPPGRLGLPPSDGELDQLRTAAAEQGAALAASAPEGRELHFSLVDGEPAEVVPERVEKGEHDLVVAGTHGRRGIRRALLGSVAEQLARKVACNVLIVHPSKP